MTTGQESKIHMYIDYEETAIEKRLDLCLDLLAYSINDLKKGWKGMESEIRELEKASDLISEASSVIELTKSGPEIEYEWQDREYIQIGG